MAHKPHTPMSIENRAKQFMPFSALKGLYEALASKEAARLKKADSLESAADPVCHIDTTGRSMGQGVGNSAAITDDI